MRFHTSELGVFCLLLAYHKDRPPPMIVCAWKHFRAGGIAQGLPQSTPAIGRPSHPAQSQVGHRPIGNEGIRQPLFRGPPYLQVRPTGPMMSSQAYLQQANAQLQSLQGDTSSDTTQLSFPRKRLDFTSFAIISNLKTTAWVRSRHILSHACILLCYL